MADGLDAAELERQKIRGKVKKYALFDMERMDGEPYSLEETLQVRYTWSIGTAKLSLKSI